MGKLTRSTATASHVLLARQGEQPSKQCPPMTSASFSTHPQVPVLSSCSDSPLWWTVRRKANQTLSCPGSFWSVFYHRHCTQDGYPWVAAEKGERKVKWERAWGKGKERENPERERVRKTEERRRFALASVPAVMCCQPDSRCAGIKLVHRHCVLVLCG